ncbi:protocadherin gamma-C5-like isoform X13 [Xyrauchen texanus]|uniref:protocadherin gamma-C5-like isoform X13 n=1 Tax=Xyrauchen texanus TaxID=154827 RepID=UPI0022424062|nr:protocadherin gamma-C5-like isoform X13 [Xyrauchen texanus]
MESLFFLKRNWWWCIFILLWSTIEAQIRYAIPEELREGSVVGNIAKDLSLDVSKIVNRKLHIASETGKQYFTVDVEKGDLIVNGRIDREGLCGYNVPCVLPLQAVLENPLQMHRVEIEIQDINDNSPNFKSNERILNIPESINSGAKFLLESAIDSDVESNSLKSYSLSNNEKFGLNVKTQDGVKIPELLLKQPLDREKQAVHKLILMAADGGNPVRTGTCEITVVVLDINDNAPEFEKPFYETNVDENELINKEMLRVKAIDLDDGLNGEIEYFFADQTSDTALFNINQQTGAITVQGELDHEKANLHKFDIIAKDKGNPQMEGHCSVKIKVNDVNDNAPDIIITSLSSPIPENSFNGTVVSLISTKDADLGENGKVKLTMAPGPPFRLSTTVSNHYALVTNGPLDRENFFEYKIELNAVDSGSPPLSSSKIVTIGISDVNDNPPLFSDKYYTVYAKENSGHDSILCSVSAHDPDLGENAKISYTILDSKVQDMSVSSFIYINSDNGSIFSMQSFDYEKIKVFQIHVQAKDHGSPSLSSNATVHVFILDQNDNVPAVIYPSSVTGSVSHQRMPRSAKAGHLVTKVTAVDADSGHNAWLFYRLAEATDASLFSVNLHTGEVRTKRSVSEQDDSSQRLLIEIKDNGYPMQSTTVTVEILIEDGFHEPISDYRLKTTEHNKKSGKITLYLIISLGTVSVLSLLTFFALIVKCVKNSVRSAGCCVSRTDSGYKNPNRNLQIQLNSDGPIKYVEVLGGDMMSQSQSFGSYLSPMSEFSDLTLVKPSSTTNFTDTLNVLDASLPDSAWTFESQQQKPPNTDWRFPPNQRPGPSGQHRFHTLQQRWTPYEKSRAGAHPEDAGACAGVIAGTGPWPNPPTEAEQIQVLMAAANAASEATATLGPRYNPQYGPDYRQNVYIPGSTATLTINPQQQIPQQALPPPQALPPAEAPKSAQTPASKKKPTKKDKK